MYNNNQIKEENMKYYLLSLNNNICSFENDRPWRYNHDESYFNHQPSRDFKIPIVVEMEYERILFFKPKTKISNSYKNVNVFIVGIEKDGNLNIIDSDSFVINNKMYREQNIIVYGKYLNNSITTKEPNSIDYICLLCMILNYLLKDVKDYNFNPLSFFESSKIHNITIKEIFRKVRFKSFILTEQDIENLFSLDLNFSKHKVSILARFKCKNQLKKIERLHRK